MYDLYVEYGIKITISIGENIVGFTEKELEQIKYALEYLHDADLSDFGDDNIEALESVMKKLGMEFGSQI